MRIFVVAFAILAVAASAAIDSPIDEYLPPTEDTNTLNTTNTNESAILTDDGYRYKTLRRLKYRQRRDVSEITNEYLPPSEETSTEVITEVKSEEEPKESAVLGESGYEYKTVRRLKYRQRRDVTEIENEYLPPSEETSTDDVFIVKSVEVSPSEETATDDVFIVKSVEESKETNPEIVADQQAITEPKESAVLGDNGYEYKTIRRLKYRQRRDVSEIANEYLPPSVETSTEAVFEVKSVEEPNETHAEIVADKQAIKEPEDSAVLGDNGYEYKTVRRLKYRQRRDVSEISNEYLAPSEETSTEAIAEVQVVEEPVESPFEIVAEIKANNEPNDSAVFGDNGYEYKTVRRLKYRQRRDVSEIEYLPPSEVTTTEEPIPEIVAEVNSVEEPEESAILGENGYEYKTVRRLKYRQRRDVSEVANEYLPPSEETSTAVAADLKSVEEPEHSTVLGANGYEYKTVRRLKYRQRRDVSEVVNEYLPPSEETSTEVAADVKSVEEPEDSTVLGANGYEYKTVRRLKYRQRRDVSEIANQYLPPAEENEKVEDLKYVEEPINFEKVAEVKSVNEPGSFEVVTEVKSAEEPENSAILTENGYEYKTVRRLKYRHRRDVSEIANEYLPPAEGTSTDIVPEVKTVEEPIESANLAKEILTETVPEVKTVEEPQESAALGENGYEYKTVRRLKYRQRRDVSEISNEYLPPAEATSTDIVPQVNTVEEPIESAALAEEILTETVPEVKTVEEPQESAVLGKNGYEYKTVRRLKYRQRRDVSEIANEYLPPAEGTSTDIVPEVKTVEEPRESAALAEETLTETVPEVKTGEEPTESAVLGENGYEYKTVRRLKYRQRRDVSEIANEYLPPSKDTLTDTIPEVKTVEEPKESADLAEEILTETVPEVKTLEEPQESAVLGENGYEYKTVRRLKYRQRRDVSEIVREYLPPAEGTSTDIVTEVKTVEEPRESAALAKETLTETVPEVKAVEEPTESAVLGENGYEYKTVRRLKYRQRRDVSEIANEYLPSAEGTSTDIVPEVKTVEEPIESADLAEEILTEAVPEVKTVGESQESAVLGENGYEYKTVRRLKYRQRRDVSEIANEYLPPAEEISSETVPEVKTVEEPIESADLAEEILTETVPEVKTVEEPQESAVLGENGYEYKTVRRLKYRQRRDVSEIAREYLPPSENTSNNIVPEMKTVEEPIESADLAKEISTETVPEVKTVEEPQESAVLGKNGYEYKTVRRLKYRQRR